MNHESYKKLIAEAVDTCTDIDLLDLVWKLLVDSQDIPNGKAASC